MKLTILAYGTRGDVQPFVALAHGLQEAGHQVTLAAPANFESWVTGFGLKFARLHGNVQEILESEQGQRWLAAGDVMKFFRELGKISYQMRHELQRDALAACEGADAILGTLLTLPYGLCLSEKLGVPLINLYTLPLAPSSHHANHLFTLRKLPFGFLNRLTHWGFEYLDWSSQKSGLNEWRRALGLAPWTGSFHAELRRRGTHAIHLYSPHLFPRLPDWGDDITLTGALMLSSVARGGMAEAQVPADFAAWLDAGPPPVFLGFGSMPVLDPMAMLELVKAVARDLKIRAVIGAGWSRVPSGPSGELFVIGAINHDWLFPRCAAVVHHGGAGTTAAGLRAAAPTVICSVFADQPLWGHRVTQLGLGSTLEYRRLTQQTLTAALRQALDPAVKVRALAMAEKLMAETGVATAVATIERVLGKG